MTRPDISWVVNVLGRYTQYPQLYHVHYAKEVLRYLKGTHDYVLCLDSTDYKATILADADFGGSPDDAKSTNWNDRVVRGCSNSIVINATLVTAGIKL